MRVIQLSIINLFLFCILISSCKKGGDQKNDSILPDKILYTDIDPDTTFTSVRSWFDTGLGTIPYPSDSSAGITLDVDHNGLPDLSLRVFTFYQFVSASSPEANYNYGVIINTYDTKDSVVFDQTSGPCWAAKTFLQDSVISGNFKFTYSASIYASGYSTGCNVLPKVGDKYYGFKIWNNGNYNYGWILLNFNSMKLTLKEYAVNLTPNKPIKAGQKE